MSTLFWPVHSNSHCLVQLLGFSVSFCFLLLIFTEGGNKKDRTEANCHGYKILGSVKRGLQLFTDSFTFLSGPSQVEQVVFGLKAIVFLQALGLWKFSVVYFKDIIPIGLPSPS